MIYIPILLLVIVIGLKASLKGLYHHHHHPVCGNDPAGPSNDSSLYIPFFVCCWLTTEPVYNNIGSSLTSASVIYSMIYIPFFNYVKGNHHHQYVVVVCGNKKRKREGGFAESKKSKV